ncbi:MAG: glycine/sarcosine/betaine reductase selenoprotein B family protein [Myxococcota bacterium]|jgi:D-proline reductase (dithiol) PrdB|nr:glycine/sarcosine/betaine reductase selenoprotein B family protein [Myxococcota bacterium]
MSKSQTGEPVDYIAETRATYDALGFPPYQWVESEGTPPWSPAEIPLEDAKVALLASGGIYRRGQRAFHYKDDASYRVIETSVPNEDLRISHFAYDVSDAREDPGVVFPAASLRSLIDEGSLGSMAAEAFTFMGGIYSARKVREELAPALVERVVDQRPDIALLVPV